MGRSHHRSQCATRAAPQPPIVAAPAAVQGAVSAVWNVRGLANNALHTVALAVEPGGGGGSAEP
jgi:hypothetical protein